NTIYSGSAGCRTFDPSSDNSFELDSILWIASISKLFTAVSCLITVEKGLMTLDTNALDIIPEFSNLQHLTGFEETVDGNRVPKLEKISGPITLLSHSSGLVYSQHHPGVREWAQYTGKIDHPFSGSYNGLFAPTIYPAGKGWAYGTGMDWAGRMVEIVSELPLEDFMRENIWSKLGMYSTTFRPELRPEFAARRVSVAIRNSQDNSLQQGSVPFANPTIDYSGGAGLYSSTEDCAKLIAALMAGGGGIISSQSVDELMSPQLETNKYFLDVIRGPEKRHLGQTWPDDVGGTFGLSSSICLEDFPGRRAARSCNWSGMPGLHIWMDRASGIGAMLATQVLPPGDAIVTQCLLELEKALYESLLG
ncbi:hypothetical protein D6D11_03724, partial [Aureobasidium pullulans]